MPIHALLPILRAHLDTRRDWLTCFHRNERQLEKWLQGEILYALDSQREALGIDRVRIEVTEDEGKIDVVVSYKDASRIWIELKHWHIGYQAGLLWKAFDCLSPKDAFGLTKDVQRLVRPARCGRGYALILFTANPGEDDWSRGLAAFNRNIAPAFVEPMTSPAQFPAEYFLGALRTGCRTAS